MTTEHKDPPEEQQDENVSDPADEKAAKQARAEKIGRYVAMFLMPLMMVGMMTWGYLYAMHSPAPHNMPVVVAGENADEFAQALQSADDGTVEVTALDGPDAADQARDQVESRETPGAVVIEDGTATVYTASSAGATQSSTVQQLVTPFAAGSGLDVETEDLVPLPDNDSAGLGAMFLTTALVMAGYLPLSITLSNAPQLLLLKRRAVPILAGWSALIAALVWVITGPILGVVSSGDAWAVMGIAWLGVFAISMVQMFLTRILGPMAVLAAMLLLMVLGVPSSNMSVSLYMVPTFYQALHSFLPTPAIGESLRSVLYFGGEGVGPHLWVLIIGGIAGFLLTALIDWSKHRRGKRPRRVVLNMPSLHGGPRPKSRFWQYATLLFFPLAMVVMMISAMLGTMQSPEPRDMPVAVAGQTEEQAGELATGLEDQMPGMFDFHVVDSDHEAYSQVEARDVAGAFILPSAASSEATVITNQAAGTSSAQTISMAFSQIAEAQGMQYTVDDVAPLPESDSMGTVSLYVAIGWIMAGFMVIVVGANAAPTSRPLRKLLPIVGGYSVFMSLVVWLIADPIVGAVSGHFWQLFATGVVAIFCCAMFATVLERLFGLLGILPIVGILMFLGIPASGGALSIYMEPVLFVHLHEYLPMAAAVESVRSILYFGGDIMGACILTFIVWGVVSLLAVTLIDKVKPLRTEIETITVPIYGDSDEEEREGDDEEGADSDKRQTVSS